MSVVQYPQRRVDGEASSFAVLATREGTASHAYAQSDSLSAGAFITRNLADVVHHFTLLHGRHPGMVDHAALHTVDPTTRDWLHQASDGFARERAWLSRLTSAIGPIPSTTGQAASEAAVLAQRHALDMLAQSDRRGCAFGAVAALVCDWAAVRILLERAALRVGIDPISCTLPSPEATASVVADFAETPALERALGFGSDQLLTQHRGLWDLLHARQLARGHD